MKLHCPHCAQLVTLTPSRHAGDAAGSVCPQCGDAMSAPAPDAALMDCSCGFRRVMALKYVGCTVVCPDCGQQVRLCGYARQPTQDAAAAVAVADAERRTAARRRVKGLAAYLGCLTGAVPIHDISPAGFCMDTEQCDAEFHPGQTIRLDLMFRNAIAVENLHARVVRSDFLSTGCVFLVDSPSQMEQLRQAIRDCVTMISSPGRVRDLGSHSL